MPECFAISPAVAIRSGPAALNLAESNASALLTRALGPKGVGSMANVYQRGKTWWIKYSTNGVRVQITRQGAL